MRLARICFSALKLRLAGDRLARTAVHQMSFARHTDLVSDRELAATPLARTLAKQGTAALALAVFAIATGCEVQPEDTTRLSTRGLYSDIASRTTVPGAIEYEPDYPLWSDGVQKRRWMILPAGTQIDTHNMAHWQFPIGTKLFKEFSVRGRLIETRLIERVSNKTGHVKNDYFMGTFVWSADQSEAVLTSDGVRDALDTDHDVPEQTACVECHRGEPGAYLGVSAVQLSRSGMLDTLAKRSLLSVDPKRSFPIPGDEIQVAAVGYMNANCGHCHSAHGVADLMRLRFLPEQADLPIEQSEVYTTTIGQKITDWKVHPDELQQRVVPGDPDHSALLYRMLQRGKEKPARDDQMPPLASERVHHEGIAAVRAWILTMPRDLTVAVPGHDMAHTDDEGTASSSAAAGMGAAGMAADSGGRAAADGGGSAADAGAGGAVGAQTGTAGGGAAPMSHGDGGATASAGGANGESGTSGASGGASGGAGASAAGGGGTGGSPDVGVAGAGGAAGAGGVGAAGAGGSAGSSDGGAAGAGGSGGTGPEVGGAMGSAAGSGALAGSGG
jgi:hypothetical protein